MIVIIAAQLTIHESYMNVLKKKRNVFSNMVRIAIGLFALVFIVKIFTTLVLKIRNPSEISRYEVHNEYHDKLSKTKL